MTALQDRLASLQDEARREWERRRRARAEPGPPSGRAPLPWRPVLLGIAAIGAAVALPFVVLVRGAVFFYASERYPSWLAVLAASLVTLALVTGCGAWLSRRLTGKARLEFVTRWVALPLVVGWVGYGLVYLAAVNAKTAEVRAEYRATHPLLRLALATWILVDEDLVITDLGRVAPDYPRMGLPINDRTLHYQQADGWAHAVDLRTGGRPGLANLLMRAYFELMGFETLRHVGTADHLHVELRRR